MKIESRQAIKSDLKGILNLYRHLCPDEDYSNSAKYESTWSRILNHEGLKLFVAVEGKKITACCSIAVIPNMTRDQRPYALIENVVTHPHFRRKGYGRLVVEAAKNFAEACNCYKVMLLSNAERKGAHAFYRSLGFDSDSKKGFLFNIPQ